MDCLQHVKMRYPMTIRHLTLGLGMVLLLAGAGNSAEVKTKHLSCTFAGTFISPGVETHIDTNGDMVSAGVHQGLVNCNIGRFLFQEEFEFQACQEACGSCPAGTAEYDLVQAHGVLTAEKTSEQLFFADAAGASTFCLNPDLTFSFTEHATFAGGTGEFTGASGFFDGQSTGKYLAFGSKEGVFGGFGQFSETATGTLTIPK